MIEIKMQKVVSSNISEIGYDKETKSLEVMFKTGKRYTYEDVLENVYKGFLTSNSPGSYFRKMIIGGNYKFKKKDD